MRISSKFSSNYLVPSHEFTCFFYLHTDLLEFTFVFLFFNYFHKEKYFIIKLRRFNFVSSFSFVKSHFVCCYFLALCKQQKIPTSVLQRKLETKQSNISIKISWSVWMEIPFHLINCTISNEIIRLSRKQQRFMPAIFMWLFWVKELFFCLFIN